MREYVLPTREAERLRQMVGGALFWSTHPRVLSVARWQDDDASLVEPCAEVLKQVKADVVQNDHRRAQGREYFERRRLIVSGCVAQPGAPQYVADQFDEFSVAIRDENL